MNGITSKAIANPANGNEYFFPALLCTTGLMPTNKMMRMPKTIGFIIFSFQPDQHDDILLQAKTIVS